MSMRRTVKARRALVTVAVTAGLALTVAGCGGDGGDQGKGRASSPATGAKGDGNTAQPAPSASANKTLAQVKGGADITLTITSAVRDTGGFLTVSGTVKNGGGKYWIEPSWAGDEKELAANSTSMAGAALVDQTGKKKYLILRDTDGRCLCTKFSGGIQADEEKPFYAQFPAPPASTRSVEFQIGDMPPATIDISDGQ
ncbi:hypothetical protein G3I19_11895 [Streptomyces sp. SID10853]|uniref:hypothetical protein n=1 Tax=Streptomyces sp. SID10853 TaxID=2706028 RepID=UPI0013C25106|nr:hypothetical protein [Streptomyces sp. SID10853]NDZ79205.1 hypothetical protein [Streptomyces sp. SID10853]